ncbi:MAG TPA: dihydrolipoamide acetyltransferase family protein [Woeseiaceae bacterium]|nr:dihydrolipoamide acetyltransferase family protein [Woeseiaceae bacterium]
MATFNLPDLGEGLQDAEIVEWHVAEGDSVKTDEPLLSVETAKAVVEVPSPYTGTVLRLHAKIGDIVPTGAALVDFGDNSAATPNKKADESKSGDAQPEPRQDAGTVVGNMPSGSDLVQETAVAGSSRRRAGGRVKATPAVRTQAKRLGLNLAAVTPTGKNGQVTAADLEQFQQASQSSTRRHDARKAAPAGDSVPLRGPRRAMAQSMTLSRDQVALCTIFDDADIHEWLNKRDFTPRILRAMVAGCAAEPGLNGFFDPDTTSHRAEPRIDIAMAVDTEDGLIVPVIRNVRQLDLDGIRDAVADMKQATQQRTVAPEDMRNYTITLSNFGMLAGRYATPLMVPPTVAIVGTGKLQHDVVAVMGGIEVHRRIPLSLSFDHRCITGGEACRFLAAMIQDLEKPQ